MASYGAVLRTQGLTATDVEQTLAILAARDEASLYDPGYEAGKTPTRPTRLLVEAVHGLKPGTALDVGMGQGRNALYLASLGWRVTGFDVAKAGLQQAAKKAVAAGVSLDTRHVSDLEFDFGKERWDLVLLVYPIEKRSVFRVRDALKPTGQVVLECGLNEGSGAPFEYAPGELLKIFEGFRILKYEETLAEHEWVGKPARIVRLIAQK